MDHNVILEYGINEHGHRQYYLDEARTQPVCPVSLQAYTNTGYGAVSPDSEVREVA